MAKKLKNGTTIIETEGGLPVSDNFNNKVSLAMYEDLVAENNLLKEENADLKQKIENLLTIPDEQEKTSVAAETAMFEGNTYQILLPKVNIPGLGVRTALELANDPDAIAILVKRNSSAIKKMS